MSGHSPVHFQFFGNREVTSLYFTIALVRFALGLVTVFVPIYLWQLGYPLWQILSYFLLESLYYLIIAFLGLPFLRRLTDKSLLILSLPFFILYFIGLSFLGSYPVLFFILPMLLSLKLYFFNVGYHLNFSGASDKKDMGKELGIRFMIGSLVSLTAPFLGGLIITILGYQSAFWVASLFLFISVIPLLYFPKRKVSAKLTAKSLIGYITEPKLIPYTLSGIGHANELLVGAIVWRLMLFLAVGSIEEFGGIISISLFASALVTFLAGAVSDNGHRKKVLIGGTVVNFFFWIVRAFVRSPLGVVFAEIGVHTAYPTLLVPWASQFYKLSKDAQNHSAFILSREVIYNLSRVCFLPVLIVAAYYLDMASFFLVAYVLAAGFSLFYFFANKQNTHVFKK